MSGSPQRLGTQARHDRQQMRAVRYDLRANQLMNFYVPESEGHDDYLISLTLCNRAAALRPLNRTFPS